MNSKIPILSHKEIEQMRTAGQLAAELKYLLKAQSKPGITTRELDQIAGKFLASKKVQSAFKGYQNFPATIITCLNEEVIHAIPSQTKLEKGDLLTIDLGVIWQNYFSDTATTFLVGHPEIDSEFLKAGEKALTEAIKQCIAGKKVGDISATIQTTIEKAGYQVVQMFTGHGIGQNLHLPPEIPCFGQFGTGEKLKPGMALAVEVMYTLGKSDLHILEDGWTTVTVDNSLAAQFEETVIVGQKKPEILTD